MTTAFRKGLSHCLYTADAFSKHLMEELGREMSRDIFRESLRLEETFCLVQSPCLCHLEHAARAHIQLGFECLQGQGLHKLSGQFIPVSTTFKIQSDPAQTIYWLLCLAHPFHQG